MAAELQGKRTLVTGAASGIGRQIAELFVEEGARVLLQDISAGVKEIADSLGCPSVTGDVSKASDVQAAIAATQKAFGGSNIVNMASVAGVGGCPMFGAYAATKAAVISLTRTAAAELRDSGVRV